ncbi:fluoride efflux transporter CrcB [Virgibacillus byunsanensis]|uniref:Fluoride-specific ion channel FluC n=1 Tax=Virgibacillus byunsanensis TaxID=570945 RepID=A0ABW3LNK3_9BACI
MNISFKIYMAIGIGGMFGAVGRYSVSILFESVNGFPYATLTVNLIGCFLLSLLLHHEAIKKRLSPEVFAALGTGMLGAFTTFSTFAVETIEMGATQIGLAIFYVIISVFGGLLCCFAGYKLAIGNKKVTRS